MGESDAVNRALTDLQTHLQNLKMWSTVASFPVIGLRMAMNIRVVK
jgi:hypothetical protein